MLEFVILILVLSLLAKIPVGEPVKPEKPECDPYNNGTKEAHTLNNAWEFKSLDDCFEFRELRRSGWRGNAEDFYKWKEEE